MQFIPVLATGLITFILLFAFVNAETTQGPTGRFVAGELKTLDTSSNDHFFIAEDQFIGRVPREIANSKVEITSGFLQESKNFEGEFNADTLKAYNKGYIQLDVKEDSYGGPVIVRLNGDTIYHGTPRVGKNWVEFDKDLIKPTNKLTIVSEKGWQFWNGAHYNIDISIGVETVSVINLTFSPYEDYPSAEFIATLSQTKGRLTIKFNGQTVYNGVPDYNLIRIPLGKPLSENTIYIDAPLGDAHVIEYADIVLQKPKQ